MLFRFWVFPDCTFLDISMRLEKAQYNPSLKLAIDIARVVEAPIEEIFVFK